MPTRIQCQRTKGWRKPENALYVGRGPSSKWGNPFTIDIYVKAGRIGYRDTAEGRRMAAEDFRNWLIHDDYTLWCGARSESDAARSALLTALPELRGRDLMCWCPSGEPCHADVLLELANAAAGRVA